MAEDDDLGMRKCLVQLGGIGAAELIAVRDDDGETIELDFGDLGKLGPQIETVAIAVHRRHRGQGAELNQEIAAPDVPTVQDVIDFAEDVEYLWAQHTVGIRDDTKSHLPVAGPIARAVT